ncbi:ABC transporter permease [Pseudodesulfovibrio senegalensis]|uniref:Transport permease protein n=1 Tax=Pseudodesulfovibrio senegalensis TaxID=1721087 RepID=A0A6N6N2P3_9BACT|nr:ABC transporter permease [Pseudodesulfovibrio senegalensis]KAB1441306.1 ABC transporter permease [Pseudodesulfovibrio senegalensis]
MDCRHETVIRAGQGARHYWQDMLRYRELFFFLAWRDLLVRYKQTAIGIAWAVLRPVLAMMVFSVVFGRLAGLPSDGNTPYPIMVFAAMLPWQFFASGLSDAGNSLVSNAPMVSKVWFPRMLLPASSILVNAADMILSLMVLALLMLGYGFAPSWRMLLLPALVLPAAVTTLGAGLALCALNVTYRDFRYIVPFIIQLGMYVSPVGFSSAVVPQAWRAAYYLNPMAGVIDGFRWAILGTDLPYLPGLIISAAVSLALLFTGLRIFRRMEATFADTI